MDVDLSQLTGPLTGLAGAAAIVIAALGRRRDSRAEQWADIVKERNALQQRLDELRRKYDALLDWAYDVRAEARRQGIELPEVPRGDDR